MIEVLKRGIKIEDCLVGFNDGDILIRYENIKDNYEKDYKLMRSWMKIKVAYDKSDDVLGISLKG
ncbi:MAG: hypothetical protein HGA57_06900 [Chlorobium limicola]|uniref:Uncharacterized protein n=1 Tax=Chlorobium limicola (strain DSM 245 / NBRC 103803 / 6330) TaxID=290315 RepID=B3ECL2_CHLL2|nr:hypothetical protein [Chlorobium limicola]ACD90287.1 hypothetical protein Clim_1220 [Chlorobium limicola DSM 245]NTV21095.1 hypothetical protein [Chlorobium limicola]